MCITSYDLFIFLDSAQGQVIYYFMKFYEILEIKTHADHRKIPSIGQFITNLLRASGYKYSLEGISLSSFSCSWSESLRLVANSFATDQFYLFLIISGIIITFNSVSRHYNICCIRQSYEIPSLVFGARLSLGNTILTLSLFITFHGLTATAGTTTETYTEPKDYA